MSNIEVLLTIAIIGLVVYELFQRKFSKKQFKEDTDRFDESLAKFTKFVNTVAFHEVGFGVGDVYKNSQYHDHVDGKLKISFKEKNVDVLVIHSSKESGYGIYKIHADDGYKTGPISWDNNAAIIWVLRGRVTFKLFGENSDKIASVRVLEPGDYINLEPGLKHIMDVDRNTVMLAVFIPPLCATVEDVKRMREEVGFET